MKMIMFRGKRVDNGEWSISSYPYGTIHSGTVIHDFIPETVGEYTGKSDGNGERVFEGDIIKVAIEGESIDGFPAKISYQNYLCDFDKDTLTFGFRYIDDEEGLVDDFELWNYLQEISLNIWVIGNKWDNPELIKKKG